MDQDIPQLKLIEFAVRHPDFRSKTALQQWRVTLNSLSPAARFLAENILTTDNTDDTSLIYVVGLSPREKNNDPEEIAMMDRCYPGYADKRETITWKWPPFRSNDTPKKYFERQITDMRRAGGLLIKSRFNEEYDISSLESSAAEKIRNIRHKSGLSQVAFAEKYEIPRRTLENWEAGIAVPPEYVLRMLSSLTEFNSKNNCEKEDGLEMSHSTWPTPKRIYQYKEYCPYGAADLFVMDAYVEHNFSGNVPDEIMRNGGKWDDDRLVMTMPGGQQEVYFLMAKDRRSND